MKNNPFVVLVFLCQICSLSSKIAVAQIKAKTKRDRVSDGFYRVAWVPGRPGFTGSTPKRVFASTRTGSMPGSAGSRVDPPGRAGPGFKTLENTKFILKFQKANPARPIYTLNTLSSFLTGSHLWFRHQQNPPWKSQNYAPLRCISHPRHPQPMRIASSRTSRENLSGFASPLSILPFILYPYNYTQIIFQQFQSSTNHVSCLDCWNFIGKVLRSLDYFTRGRHTTCLINRPHGSSQWH